MQLHRFARAGKRREHLIADFPVALVEGMFGQIIRRNRDAVLRIAIDELLGRLPRVVGRVESDVEEERPGLRGAISQVGGGVLRPDARGVFHGFFGAGLPGRCRQPLAFERFIPRGPRIAGGGAIVSLGARLEHPGADAADFLETALQVGVAEMPLADEGGVVPRGAQRLSPEGRLLRPGAGPKSGQAAVQHGAAGDTDRRRPGALVEALREGAAPLHQAIQVRRLDLGIVDRLNGADQVRSSAIRKRKFEGAPAPRPANGRRDAAGGGSQKLAALDH